MNLQLETPDTTLVDTIHPAVNIEERRLSAQPSILLMHYTGMSCAKKAIDWLACEESGVSCHYVVDEAGHITQMVTERARAWHAGKSYWAGETDINSASIGIEIQNPGHEDGYNDFPKEQMAAVLALSKDILSRNAIQPKRVLGHSDIAPGRKIDPGEKFNWQWLAENGVGHWVEPEPPGVLIGEISHGQNENPIARTQELLKAYGYGIDITGRNDAQSRRTVSAFQRHFRPIRIDGLADNSTLTTLERLIAALPESALA